MKIIISGVSGVGKTSLCERIAEIAKESGRKCGGVLCPVTGEGSTAIDLSTGEKEEMATTDSKAEGIPVGNYIINEEGISLGKKAIRNATENGSDLVFIDEIGPLEREGNGLFPEAERAIATEKDVIIVIRKNMLEEFTGKFPGTEFRAFIINQENRDQLAEKIMGELNAA